jgi:hypothetical protein
MELLETYAPAFGLLGTVIGLVYMLSNLKDPSTIGQGLALALLTTFYGLIISNVIFTSFSFEVTVFKVHRRSTSKPYKESSSLYAGWTISKGYQRFPYRISDGKNKC